MADLIQQQSRPQQSNTTQVQIRNTSKPAKSSFTAHKTDELRQRSASCATQRPQTGRWEDHWF